MMQPKIVAIAVLAIVAAGIAVASQLLAPRQRLEGRASIIDGDSMRVAGREVRLRGIDAPEGRQTCLRNGLEVQCGEEARQALRGLVGTERVTCRLHGNDQHDRALATCEAAGVNVNRRMVETGMAVSFGRTYSSEEAAAKAARRGIWASEFERPQTWRQKQEAHVRR